MQEQKRLAARPDDGDQALIRETADAVARHHQLDVERVHAVYQRLSFVLAEPPFPPAIRPVGPNTRRVWFSPAFQRALLRLGPAAGLQLFERTDPLVLHRRSVLLGHLGHPLVPFLTLDELAGTIDAYIRHRRMSRDCLNRTGWPATSFARSAWLDWHFFSVYPTRIPARVFNTTPMGVNPEAQPLPRDEQGNVDYAGRYTWSTAPDLDLAPLSRPTVPATQPREAAAGPCRYEEAPLLPGVTDDFAGFLEEHRDQFLHVQLDVLTACRDAVRARDAEHLWRTVWSLFTNKFRVDQLYQFLEADELYRRLRLLPIVAMRCGTVLPQNISGGLTDLLRLVAHCEAEIRMGRMDQTRRRLLRAPKDLIDIGCYFQAVRHPAVALLDQILEEYWEREQETVGFWHEFGERVYRALEQEADTAEVTITKRVEKPLAPYLQEALQGFTDFHLAQLRSLGAKVVVQFAPSASGGRRTAVYSLRKGGQYWIVHYEDEIAVFRDNEIARVIDFLIRNQGQGFQVIHAVMGAAGTLGADVAVSGKGGTAARMAEEGLHGGMPGSQPIADVAVLKGLEEMIERKKMEISEAERAQDAERVLEVKEEMAEWEQRLREVKGKGGRSREFADDANTAQQRLSEAFRRLCRSLEPDAPGFVRHLQNSLRITMSNSSYCPDRLIPWEM